MMAFSSIASAQEDRQVVQDSTLRINNAPVPSTTTAPQIEDARAKSDREIRAEKKAKDKGKVQKQTMVRPDEIVPPAKDSLKINPQPR